MAIRRGGAGAANTVRLFAAPEQYLHTFPGANINKESCFCAPFKRSDFTGRERFPGYRWVQNANGETLDGKTRATSFDC